MHPNVRIYIYIIINIVRRSGIFQGLLGSGDMKVDKTPVLSALGHRLPENVREFLCILQQPGLLHQRDVSLDGPLEVLGAQEAGLSCDDRKKERKKGQGMLSAYGTPSLSL